MSEKITVIIPTYNRAKYVLEAIQSVKDQTLKADEIIVVDDGSTDNTELLIKATYPEVIYLYQENSGPSTARNTGVNHSKYMYLAFLDSDDIWNKDCLKELYIALKSHSHYDISMGKMQYFKLNEKTSIFEKEEKEPFHATSFCISLIKKDVFEYVGMLKEGLYNYEDIEWFSRFMDSGRKIKYINYCCSNYRRHADNISKEKNQKPDKLVSILRESVKRKNRNL